MLERIALILQIVLFAALLFMCVFSFCDLMKLKRQNKKELDKYTEAQQMTDWTLFSSKLDLIEKRLRKGWSHEELAEYSNIHPHAIKEFEDGVRIPSRPIQRLLYMTFERLEQTIESYSKLSLAERITFHERLKLVNESTSITRES